MCGLDLITCVLLRDPQYLRSNYTYSDTSKCISDGNMVLTLREEPITIFRGVTFCGCFGQKILPSKTFPAVD